MRRWLAGLALCALAGAAVAHSGVQNAAVMARMESMKQIGDAMKLLGGMAKGQTAFDAATARQAAADVARHSADTVALFEAPEGDPKSEALPAIWEDFADFSAKAGDLTAVAEAASAGIETQSDLRAALADLGGACKACHSRYRE